jgi:hypothetical protein
MGAATSLRMTRTTIFGFWFWFLFLRTQYSSTYGRPSHHLPDGRFASRGALVELFLFIPRPHSFLVAARPAATQRTETVWALVVELGPAPPRCPSESWSSVRHIQAGPRFTRGSLTPLGFSAGGGLGPVAAKAG